MTINLLDGGLAIVILLFLVRGLLRGLVNEVAGLLSLFLGLFLAGRYYHQVAPQFHSLISDPGWAAGAAYAAIFIFVIIVVALLAAVVRKFLELTFMAWLDYLLGGVVGAAKGVLICAIALALVQLFVPDSPFLKNSLLAKHIEPLTRFAKTLLPTFS